MSEKYIEHKKWLDETLEFQIAQLDFAKQQILFWQKEEEKSQRQVDEIKRWLEEWKEDNARRQNQPHPHYRRSTL